MLNREEHIIKLQEFISSRIEGIGSFAKRFGGGFGAKKESAISSNECAPMSLMMEDSALPQCAEPMPEPSLRSAPRSAQPGARPDAGVDAGVGTRAKATRKSPKKASEKEHFSISSFISSRFEDSAVAKQLNLYMHERDITTAMIYKRCYIDRKLISKITNRSNYHPSKNTMLALCLGLQLSMPEAVDFLALGGFSFSNTSKFDLIMEYMLTNEIYDVRFVNEMLEKYDQPLLGA